MSSPDLPQLFFSNRFCPNLSAIVVSEILMGTEEPHFLCAKLFTEFPKCQIFQRWRGFLRSGGENHDSQEQRGIQNVAYGFFGFFFLKGALMCWVKYKASFQWKCQEVKGMEEGDTRRIQPHNLCVTWVPSCPLCWNVLDKQLKCHLRASYHWL